MELAISYAVISLVALCATIFVAALNLKQARHDVRQLDFRVISIELLTLTIWVVLFTKLVSATTPQNQFGYLILFILAISFGVLLIQNTLREMRTRKAVQELLGTLNKMNIRLRELDTQKTEFVSLASHQLRGPLAAIHGHATMMIEEEYGKVPKHLQEPLRKIVASSQSLGVLINDFLDVARLERGDLEYKIEPFNLVEVLDATVSDFEILMTQAELECKKTYDSHDSITVLGDPIKMRHIFTKLLDNAIKYTPAGMISISVAVKSHDAIISISDSGIGVFEEDMQEMFKKFKRANNASEVSVSGSGLGLYTAKEMIEAQGGRIWVESPGKNKGTRFFIALPLRD